VNSSFIIPPIEFVPIKDGPDYEAIFNLRMNLQLFKSDVLGKRMPFQICSRKLVIS
jgi:hypothetical protein